MFPSTMGRGVNGARRTLAEKLSYKAECLTSIIVASIRLNCLVADAAMARQTCHVGLIDGELDREIVAV